MTMPARCLLSILVFISVAAAQDGAALFQQRCATCHDAGAGRAPRTDALKQMSPENVYRALTQGSMAAMGGSLPTSSLRAIAISLTGKAFGASDMPKSAYCANTNAPFSKPFDGPYWNGWGADQENHRAQPAAMAGIAADQVPRLKLKWAFGFPGAIRMFTQPTVAGGRIFTGSSSRQVYSLDAASGCIYWAFEPDFPVRSAATIAPFGNGWASYFSDQNANMYAVDAGTGKLLWKTHVDDFPGAQTNGAPKLYEGRIYLGVSSVEEVLAGSPQYECCKFRGSVVALDAATGKQLWKTYTIADAAKPTTKNSAGTQLWGPSGAGIWSSPTIDTKTHTVYVTTGDGYSNPAAPMTDSFLALDAATGKILWSRQLTGDDAFNIACGSPAPANCPQSPGPDHDFGQSAILVTLANGKRALIAGQKSGMVHALDPDRKGEILWQTRVGKGGMLGGVQWGSAADLQHVYVALSDLTLTMSDKPSPTSRPTMFGSFAEFDSKAGGGLFALNLADGKRAWYTPSPCSTSGCTPALSAAVALIPGVVFSGAIDGHLRGYSTKDGKIVWEVDTAHDFPTLNGVKATGGALDGPGPVVAGGMLYVNSGYGFVGQMPGNVLLAYSIDGK